MEHVLHTFFALLFCLAAAGCITAPFVPAGRRTVVPLVVLAVLLVATRYEGAFLVAAAFALLCLRRRFGAAALVAGAGAAPAVAYGLVSTAHGELFLPNSVLLKTATGAAGVAGFVGPVRQRRHRRALPAPAGPGRWSDREQILLLLSGITALLHLTFAPVSPFFRYEAYLVVLFVVALSGAVWRCVFGQVADAAEVTVNAGRPSRPPQVTPVATAALLSLLLFWVLFERGRDGLQRSSRAVANITEQHHQMGLFLTRFYPGAAVAANDIGAINYQAPTLRCLDLWGLGSSEVRALRLRGVIQPKRH